MFEFDIEILTNRFENIKEEVNKGKLLLYAEWEVEDLLGEAIRLKTFTQTKEEIEEINALINQLSQYLYDIQGLIENNSSSTI